VTFAFDVFFAFDAATCDTRLMQGLAAAIAAEGQVVRYLPSGAGHDAMSFDGVLPHAMLFVRCGNGGISHDPAETLSAADAEIATRVLLRFFECFDPALLQ
jgi:acetylornithine deacetylase/succinyl-diaminopimelate desuccinylase-like protein